MAGFRIEGNTSGNVAEVDTNNNIKVNLPTTASQAGYVSTQTVVDAGSFTGSKLIRTADVSYDGRLAVGLDTPLALYNFTATTQNTGDFKHAFTTMTMTQSSGFLNINPALSTVSGNYAYLQSWRYFALIGDADLHIEFTGLITTAAPANQILEAGLFAGTAGTVPVDGVFFRLTNAGLKGVIAYNGVETETSVAAPVTANAVAKFKILVGQRQCTFWADDVLIGTINTPTANAVPFQTLSLPVCMMMRNSGTVTGGFTTRIGTFHVTMQDVQSGRTWAEACASQGNAYQGQDGDVMGSLALYSNAALAAAAALTNTTAAAGNTGLGGVVQVLPTLVAGTDGILLSYQNPVGSVSQPPKTLIIRGITLSAAVQTVLAGGPLVYVMGAAFGHTAVSLATTESTTFATNTTKAPRRVPLGNLSCAATSAVGTNLGTVNLDFSAPIQVNPGEFFAITARNLGTVTTTGAVVLTASIDHYFE